MADTFCTVNGCYGIWLVVNYNLGFTSGGFAIWSLVNQETGEIRSAPENECTVIS
ncbi:hypothetical protein BDV30DRAFT_212059 [Aspergillus minisclerotigenes]|uniref:Uncharacterized protein n=1 Tax=Aspergillus minisclerotigenes TaxID=656917 RepID=A0A5N6J0L8_9EURO|nr:hypothetical protein BDV30DRAFT_212059 [Aspergillus minisclerotigenes]